MLVPARLIGDILCVALCLVAALYDLRLRRIPNFLTYPAIIVGLGLSVTGGGHSVGAALSGFALLGGLFALFAALTGGFGWGDAKLMAAVGALLGWPLGLWPTVLYALVYTALIGGVLALVIAARNKKLGPALQATVSLPRKKEKRKKSGVSIPYGVAICFGTIWAVLGKYFNFLLIG